MRNWMTKYSRIDIGLNLMDSGKHEDAIKHFTELIELHPDDDELYFWRGQVYRSAGKALQQVSKCYSSERAEIHTPDESKAFFQKSIEDYEKALEIHCWDNKGDQQQ